MQDLSDLILDGFKSRVRAMIAHGRDALTGGASLRAKILRNVGWMAVVMACDFVVRFISSVIITRLLDPSAYGLMSTVMVFLVFVGQLSDLGIKQMVLADDRGDDPKFLGVLWTMQGLRGFLIAGVMGVVSLLWMHALSVHWISKDSNYANPILPQLLLLICLTLVISGFSSLNEFRLVRHLERGPIAILDITNRVITTVATITLAFIFRSVWAIALGMIVGSLARLIQTHIMLAGPRMRLTFDWAEIRKVMAVSRWVALNSFMSMMSAQADKILIGYAFGMTTLGVYAIAMTLYAGAAAFIDQLNSSLGVPVIRALLDKTEAERFSAYYKFRLPIDLYCAAVGAGMALFGPLFFKLAYDPRYAEGGIFFALLGMKIILMPIHLSGNFLFAQLRFKLMSLIGTIRSLTYFTCMGVAVWLNNIHLMVAVIALEIFPEIMSYFAIRRTGVPFRLNRDGALLALAALVGGYLLVTYIV